MNIFQKIGGIVTKPAKTFKEISKEKLTDAFAFYALIIIVPVFLLALFIALGLSIFTGMIGGAGLSAATGFGGFFIMLFSGYIGRFIGFFIGGLIIYLGVLIFSKARGLETTYKALAYSSTPGILLGWIPYVGFLAGIWGLVLAIIGIKEVYKIKTGQAVASVLVIPIVLILIFVIIALILGVGLLSYFTGLNAVT
ncbi:hypothetical protein AUJ10_01225 [Candidatus Pacearchaeota archaeon CG1_02_31_27]|nr:MAG: hypothetical protein AUJ10_01225 [Candidatus Pacearchaeota archaeon CG1_02_31_27]PIN92038.1 MAG: hypothetical protein COU55_03190 [Candidatus Pacearchaeota archaeon CG10_big_fil_rev_8_21_14_0_10_31_59]PIZ81122.1 MAG: hypothetical protein COX99_00800 [Candidatus Pacearchaeota archaeon CG_4_10_14_0_2_um_filter_31_10]